MRSERGLGHLWLRVDGPDPEAGFFANAIEPPDSAGAWSQYTIDGTVADDALAIVFGGVVPGDGTVTFDGLRLEVEGEDGSWIDAGMLNGSFEAGLEGWEADPGYAASVVDGAIEGERAFRLAFVDPGEEGPLAESLFDARPEVGETVTQGIGRGVTVRLPLALVSRQNRTRPLPDAVALQALRTDLDELGPATHPMTRVADVIVAWTVFQHFYPYSDVVSADWDAALREALVEALSRPDDPACEALRRLVHRLEDGHGNVGCQGRPETKTFPASIERVEGRAVVVAVSEGATLQRGDVLLTIDGADVEARVDSLAALASGSPQWRLRRAYADVGRGLPDSYARVEVDRAGERIEVVETRALSWPPPDARPDSISEIRPGVLYVDLTRVSDGALGEHWARLAEARGVVFDLRGYPRLSTDFLAHLTDRPITSTLWELPRTLYPDRQRPVGYDTTRWAPSAPASPRVEGRVAFLTDARAISYAESLLGIVDHYDLGTIVGAPTAGANGDVNPFSVPGGHQVFWTGLRVRQHDGSTLHGVGIHPDVSAQRTLVGVRAGRDEVLERALDWIGAADE